MENPYSKYKQRLYGQLQENPELDLMNRSIGGLSQPFQEINNQIQSMLQRDNSSPGAKVAATLRGEQQLQDERSTLFGQALGAMEQRKDSILNKVAEIDIRSEEWENQQEELKAKRKTSILRTGLQLAGMAVGAIATAATGGIAPLVGAAIGGGIGQTAGGFMGIDKDGNLSTSPENFDAEAIMQGASGAIGAYAGYANEKKINGMAGTLATAMATPEFIDAAGKMPSEQLALWSGQFQSAIMRGDEATLNALINAMRGTQ